ncbi:hypothetical protein PTSG_06063 [Salpingoeca rosetta]|uniref:Uncharacterized protein n=1 Tax=Salpingoeca rosetta (strain ATCC 50818 / BSB-021) TaxID=946362 RepID=F2UDK7_SALR5|nr:uncharacterized protein PTSG_06063 [Salpingoeca rosetta]EGD74702.1 hypothetical protein PTSG_06063 [Salpingoeca rosetta]|eukprot:XP_004992959.1 hypothetical protein PTSG_06063 [Salpingoeca rosetta]
MTSYNVVLRGTEQLPPSARRDLSKTNLAIARVLARSEREAVVVHLFSHGVQCVRPTTTTTTTVTTATATTTTKDSTEGGGVGGDQGTKGRKGKKGSASASSTRDRRTSAESGDGHGDGDDSDSRSNRSSTEKEEGGRWLTPWRRKKEKKRKSSGGGSEVVGSGFATTLSGGFPSVFADVNIFNILLAGANGRCFVFLARDSQPGEREEGDHTVYVFECTEPLIATEMADKLNKESRLFMRKLKDVRSDAAARDLHDASAEAYRSEKLAFEQESSYLSKDLDSLVLDEYEKSAYFSSSS